MNKVLMHTFPLLVIVLILMLTQFVTPASILNMQTVSTTTTVNNIIEYNNIIHNNRMLFDINFQIIDVVDYRGTKYIVVNSTNALPYASGIDIFTISGVRVSKKEEAIAILAEVVFRKIISQITISDIEALRDFHKQVQTLREVVTPYKSFTESIIHWLTTTCIPTLGGKICAIDAIKKIDIPQISQLVNEVYSWNSYLGMIVDSSSRIDNCLPVVINELERRKSGENIPFSALKAPLLECVSAFNDLKRGIDGINSKISNLDNIITTVLQYSEFIRRRDPTGLVGRFIDYFIDFASNLKSQIEKTRLLLSTISEEASEYSKKFSVLASPEEEAKKELFGPWSSRVVAPIMIYSTLGLVIGILLTVILAIITMYNREGFVGRSRVRALLTPIAYTIFAILIFSVSLYLMTGRMTVNPIDHFVELGRLGVLNTVIVIVTSIVSTILLGSMIIYGINRNRIDFKRSLRLSAKLALAPLVDIYKVYIFLFLVVASMAVVLLLSIGARVEPSITLFAVLSLLIGIVTLGRILILSTNVGLWFVLMINGMFFIFVPMVLNVLSYILPIHVSYPIEFVLISLFIGFVYLGGGFAFIFLGSMRTIGLFMIITTLLTGLYNSLIGIIIILIATILIVLGGMEDEIVREIIADSIAMPIALITMSLLIFFVLPQINLDQEVLLNSSINSILGPFAGILLWFTSKLMVGTIPVVSAYLYVLLVLMISIFSSIVYLVTLNIIRIILLIKYYNRSKANREHV